MAIINGYILQRRHYLNYFFYFNHPVHLLYNCYLNHTTILTIINVQNKYKLTYKIKTTIEII
jgi:hypothetical protein